MRDSASYIDWIGITVRWVVIVAISLWLGLGIGYTWPIVIVLALGAVGNIASLFISSLVSDIVVFRGVSLVGDLAFACLLYAFSGSSQGPLGLVGLLPVITSALYFHWIGAFLSLVLTVVIQGVLAALSAPFEEILLPIVWLIPIYLLAGLIAAFLGKWLNVNTESVKTARTAFAKKGDALDQARRRALYNLVSLLSSSLNYQRVMEIALDRSAAMLVEMDSSADRMVSAVLLFSDDSSGKPYLQLGHSRRFMPADMRVKIPGTKGLIGHTIDDGQACLSTNIYRDPELSHFTTLHECRSAYALPLRSGLDAYGLMLFAHPDPEFFVQAHREVLDIVGNQSMIALQNARLYQDLASEKERMMEIQEEGRKKMARDLHDGPTQSIAAIAMRVNFARRLMERDEKAASEELFKIEDLARRTTKEIRHMLFTLRPLVLESAGLIAALESMAEKMKETYSQEVIIEADTRVIEKLEAGKQAVVFYIAEEAVTNARKHAQAAHIWVRLKLLKQGLSLLEIEDDGVGFNIGRVDFAYENRGSLGMLNMRERTELVNGHFHLDSTEGSGTRIQVVIPLTDEAADRLRRGLG